MVTATSGTGTIRVVRAGTEHLDALTGLIRETWDPTATRASVAAARAAAGEPPTFLLLSGDEAVGHVTSYPMRLWDGAAERPAHWLKGLMVVPRHRNGPVGFLVLKEAARQLGDAAALVVEPTAIRLFTALGFADLGQLANRVKLLRAGAVLRRLDVDALGWRASRPRLAQVAGILRVPGIGNLVGALVALGTGAWTLLQGPSSWGFRVQEVDRVDPTEVDALWRHARTAFAAAPARDGQYLERRYRDADTYRCVTAHRAGRLAALAIVRRPRPQGDPRLRGIRVATVSDILFAPGEPEAAAAVLAGAEQTALRLGADALLCSASHGALNRALRARAFIAAPANVHLVVRATGGALSAQLDAWWLTRGDSDADEVF